MLYLVLSIRELPNIVLSNSITAEYANREMHHLDIVPGEHVVYLVAGALSRITPVINYQLYSCI